MIGIVDHHEDEGAYAWVEGAARNVEFGIGSCASLVTEMAQACSVTSVWSALGLELGFEHCGWGWG